MKFLSMYKQTYYKIAKISRIFPFPTGSVRSVFHCKLPYCQFNAHIALLSKLSIDTARQPI